MTEPTDKDILRQTGGSMRAARLAANLNLTQLARLTGISQAALSLIETGKRDPRLTTLNRIAEALRVPLSSLVDPRPPAASKQGPASGSTANGHDLGQFLE